MRIIGLKYNLRTRMLRLIPPSPPLTTAEQFALDTLLDQSRLLRVDGGAGGVELRIVGAGRSPTIATARGRGWGIATRDGGVDLDRSVLTLVVELAGAVLEQRSEARDRYERVPPTENALVRDGGEREPVVGHIAIALRQAAIAAAGRKACALLTPWPDGKRWAMAMSHDLDVVSLWPAYTAVRAVELLGKGDVGRTVRVLVNAGLGVFGNPVWRAAQHILRVERERGVRSTWFVLAGTPTFDTMRAGDLTYAPEAGLARRVIADVLAAGHEVGLHGSFATFVARDRFAEQRGRLASIAGAPAAGVRQHFLRMRPGESHVAMVDAGFTYDSTFGFSERNGFRLGVADVIPVWDHRGQRALAIDEVPFTWMDRALSKHRNIEDPVVWVDDAFAIARAVRGVEGVWNGIWHPNMDDALGFPGAPAAFRALVDGLVAEKPWSATLGEIVAWRRARRAARAPAAPDTGTIRLRGAANVTLEDRDGRPLKHVAA